MLGKILKDSWYTVRGRWWLLIVGILLAAVAGGPDRGIVGAIYGLQEIQRVLADAGVSGDGAGLPPLQPATDQPALLATGIGLLAALLCGGVLVLIAAAVVVRLAQGALIAGAGDDGFSFSKSFRLAWRRLWRLIIIISIPPIPVTVSASLSTLLVGGLLLAAGLRGDPAGIVAYLRDTHWLHIVLIALNVPFVLTSLVLAVLQIPADRVCVLDDRLAIEAFKLGWRGILPSWLLFAALLVGQLALGIGAAWGLRMLRDLLAFSLVWRSLGWVLNGLLLTYFSVMWTRAWIVWNSHENKPDFPT